MLPRSEGLHKFQSTYGTLCPQGWRVQFTHSAAEASYDHMWSLALWFSLSLYAIWYCSCFIVCLYFVYSLIDRIPGQLAQYTKSNVHNVMKTISMSAIAEHLVKV